MAKDKNNPVLEAADAYGIAEEFIQDASVSRGDGVIAIVTHGGVRVRWCPKRGCLNPALTDIEITGVNPVRRKVLAGREPDETDAVAAMLERIGDIETRLGEVEKGK